MKKFQTINSRHSIFVHETYHRIQRMKIDDELIVQTSILQLTLLGPILCA